MMVRTLQRCVSHRELCSLLEWPYRSHVNDQGVLKLLNTIDLRCKHCSNCTSVVVAVDVKNGCC